MKLWMKLFLGMAVGITLGLILREKAILFKGFGTIFLNLLSMVVGLLVFSSIITGIASMGDIKKLGRIGLKSLLLYFFTTVVAIIIGLSLSKIIRPGCGMSLSIAENTATDAKLTGNLLQLLINIVPSNPIAAFAGGNILQVIVFAIFLGISIQMSGERGKSVLTFFSEFSEIMLKMVSVVMMFAPYGVGAIMAWVVGTFGLEVVTPLIKFVAVYYLGCAIHMVFVFGGLLKLGSKISPVYFFKAMTEAIAFAASTASSSATLPLTIKCVREKLKVPSSITGFVLPLGATVNMNGTALFQGMASVFIAQAYGIELSFLSLVIIVVTATLSAVGSAGIPGSGIVTLTPVLASVGIPLEGIAILTGIDRLRDIVGTPVNILGDAVVAVCVSSGEPAGIKQEEQLGFVQ